MRWDLAVPLIQSDDDCEFVSADSRVSVDLRYGRRSSMGVTSSWWWVFSLSTPGWSTTTVSRSLSTYLALGGASRRCSQIRSGRELAVKYTLRNTLSVSTCGVLMFFFYIAEIKPSKQTLCSRWTPTSPAFSADRIHLESILWVNALRHYSQDIIDDQFPIIFTEMLFNIPSDMEHGSEPAVLPQLLQDEDVGCYRGHSHELWSGAECLQSLVSGST